MSDKVVFNMERDVKRDFWERCFLEAMGRLKVGTAGVVMSAGEADAALEEWKKRFEVATQHIDVTTPIDVTTNSTRQQKDPTHRDGPFADRVYNRLAQMGGPQ